MKNFSQKFAIRCTELEWKTSSIEKQSLEGRIIAMGYNLSELKFYPNKPFLATFYKNKPGLLGTTNTPSKEGRMVIEKWNPDLFYALCCQRDGLAITPGEWFTDKDGKIHECTRADSKWIIHDYQSGKNDAFPRAQVHKSTLEELVTWFESGSAELSFLQERMLVANEILNSVQTKEVTAERDIQVAEPVSEHIEPYLSLAHNADAALGDSYLFGDGSVRKINDTPAKVQSITGPMTFKEILSWFGDGNAVVVGTIQDDEITCSPFEIEAISRDVVAMIGKEKPVPFDQIYKSKEAFLLHALTTLKKQA